ncbi:MAG TPA: DUF1287 domain-containing protein [Pyrinomonadaceae bacterium]|jgi:uncharacterized protein YijF (DUF1287 family)|nr:DUF1287 domain-containing protein [Pyrinomonadaceae bacterium]
MNRNLAVKLLLILTLSLTVSCQGVNTIAQKASGTLMGEASPEKPLAPGTPEAIKKMLDGAVEQTRVTKTYDPAYVVLAYPNGDVPAERGVCTDVIIRAMRKAGIDLQKEVHEDMAANFSLYPKKWGLPSADSNIDHRRVPNLQTYFTRKGKSLSVTANTDDYKPGDFVTWDLDGKGLTHIGIVSNIWSEKNKRYYIIHNIGGGAEAEDRIFDWKITGHYRYF